jgi:glycosyltransferase involved in cell wall biosynthesis
LLLHDSNLQYVLVGDTHSGKSAIPGWNVQPAARFRRAPVRVELGHVVYQSGLCRLALDSRIGCIIYEGSPYYISTWLSALLGRCMGKRVLFWTHGWLERESGLKGFIRRLFYRIPNALLLYGSKARSIGITMGFAPGRLHIVYNSLDYDAQRCIRENLASSDHRTVRARLFSDPDLPLVICTSRLTKACRFDLLIKAQSILFSEGHRINVLLVGDGPERGPLERMAAQRSLPTVLFGACHNEQVLGSLFLSATVTVSPGKIGLTAMHSLAYGVPVITHDDPARQGPEWEAIIAGRTGEFFRRNDPRDLADVIRRWTLAPVPSASVRDACYEVIETRYNPQAQAEAINRAVRGEEQG